MNKWQRVVFFLILLFFLSLSIAVIGTAYSKEERITKKEESGRHLPTECQSYYNNGTDEWINCMGVGYK